MEGARARPSPDSGPVPGLASLGPWRNGILGAGEMVSQGLAKWYSRRLRNGILEGCEMVA